MLDSRLIRIRAAIGNPVRLLSSYKLSVVLMILGALYYLLLTIWATKSPAHVIGTIANLIPFWAVYLLLLLNLGLCLWRRLPALWRDIAGAPPAERTPPRWRRPAPAGAGEEQLRRLLRSQGYYWLRTRPAGGLHAGRQRWASLGTLIFHLALFCVALGFLISLPYRYEHKTTIAVGEQYTGAQVELQTAKLFVEAQAPSFEVEEITPAFWRDRLLFTELSARLRLADGELAVTQINRPLWLSYGSFMRLSSFGWAPAYELVDRQGRVLQAAVVKMSLFPPGQRDSFRLQGLPHRVYLELYPDATLVDGRPVNRTHNLKSPLLRVQVLRGKLLLVDRLVKPGQEVEFEGLRLRFPEIRYFGELSLLTDPGAPILFGGFLLGFIGLLLRLPGKRAEVEWHPGPDQRGGELWGFGAAPPIGEPDEEGP